jgi:hypothetical protein
MILLSLIAFITGVVLTSLVALYVFGILHDEAVRVVEGYGMVFSTTEPSMFGGRVSPLAADSQHHAND